MLFGLAAAMTLPAAALAADLICAEREALLSSLSREYRESPKELGLANNGTLVELLTSRDGSTWTMLMTRADGTACVIAAGEAWERLPEQVAAGGDPL